MAIESKKRAVVLTPHEKMSQGLVNALKGRDISVTVVDFTKLSYTGVNPSEWRTSIIGKNIDGATVIGFQDCAYRAFRDALGKDPTSIVLVDPYLHKGLEEPRGTIDPKPKKSFINTVKERFTGDVGHHNFTAYYSDGEVENPGEFFASRRYLTEIPAEQTEAVFGDPSFDAEKERSLPKRERKENKTIRRRNALIVKQVANFVNLIQSSPPRTAMTY